MCGKASPERLRWAWGRELSDVVVLWYRGRLTWVFLGAGVLRLAFLITFTMSDVATRDWIAVPQPWIAGTSAQGGTMP